MHHLRLQNVASLRQNVASLRLTESGFGFCMGGTRGRQLDERLATAGAARSDDGLDLEQKNYIKEIPASLRSDCCQISDGTSVQFALESVSSFNRNECPVWPEYTG